MDVRAGFWRRALAAAVDYIAALLVLQLLAAALYAVSGGHAVSGIAFYTSCRPTAAAPAGTAPPNAAGVGWQICTSSLFGAPTRVLFVAGPREPASRPNLVAPVIPDGSAVARVFDLDWLYSPLFVLLRWLCDRFAGGSPGRRLTRIAVAHAGSAATGRACRGPLARRYARFAWAYAPSALVSLLASACAFATGSVPPLLEALITVLGVPLVGASQVAAVLALLRRQDAFYDAAAGTAVATRIEILFARDMGGGSVAPDGPGPVADLRAALARARRRVPWLSVTLLGTMAALFGVELAFPFEAARPASVAPGTLMAWGGVDRELALQLFQPYRLLTSLFLHANAAHLVANGIGLLIAGWLLEVRLGRTLYGALFALCGLAGAAASISFHPPGIITVGASGAVLGLFAAALPIAVSAPAGEAWRWLLAWPLVVCVPPLLATDILPDALMVDRFAHAGGEAAGLALGTLVTVFRLGTGARLPSGRAGAAAAGVLATIVLATALVGGLRAPLQTVRLARADELPRTSDVEIGAAESLAGRYPDDPRALSALAQAEVMAHRPADALRDADRALAAARRLSPSRAEAFAKLLRDDMGGRFSTVGDLRAAIGQYTLALDAKAGDVVALRQRGIAEYYMGEPASALKDLDAAVESRPVDPYAALWDDIVAVRSGSPDRRALLDQAITGGAWPAPVLHFFRDDIGRDALELSVPDPDPSAARDHRCEADFYEGERLIMRGWAAEARPAITAAATECPTTFVEHLAAREELAGHGGLPPE